MKKTALQQAIIEIAELWSSPSDQPNYVQVFDVLKSKLPVEEQQISKAWSDGYYKYSGAGDSEAYLDITFETFKQQEQ
jgi:hypothetical protein